MMKKCISLMMALLMCAALVCPVFATGDSVFVPSISYKDSPEVEDAEMGGEEVDDCLIVTSVAEAEEGSTDISQEERDALLEVYEQIEAGEMELPLEEDYVVRELVDVSFEYSDCVQPGHGKEEETAKEDTTITITFDLGVSPDTDVVVLVYVDGEWVPAESVVNNGDGTVTVVLEDIGIVAFCVEAEADRPQTGDVMGSQLILWIVLMAASLAAVVVLLISRKKHRK